MISWVRCEWKSIFNGEVACAPHEKTSLMKLGNLLVFATTQVRFM